MNDSPRVASGGRQAFQTLSGPDGRVSRLEVRQALGSRQMTPDGTGCSGGWTFGWFGTGQRAREDSEPTRELIHGCRGIL